MEKFLYVFDSESRDHLLMHGYRLLKSDKKKEVYVFANRNDIVFDAADIYFIRSNTLTF